MSTQRASVSNKHPRKLKHQKKQNSQSRNGSVLVLGDISHSPRMQNHCTQLAELGFTLYIVGYIVEKNPSFKSKFADYVTSKKLILVPIPPISLPLPNIRILLPILFILSSIIKFCWLAFHLMYSYLFLIPSIKFILVQNPPTFPTFPIAIVVSFIKRCDFIIDWHNFGWSIFLVKFPFIARFIPFVRWFEYNFGRFAQKHFTVSKAMISHLPSSFSPIVLYDKADLSPIVVSDRKAFFSRFFNIDWSKNPRICVTSTSFTPDENLDLLYKSLVLYDSSNHPRPLFVFITGRGPMRDQVMKRFSLYRWKNVSVSNVWLSYQDYARVLSNADIGISLHESSSAVDLPMKIVDMFSCHLPVFAKDYATIPELVKSNSQSIEFNGLLFSTSGPTSLNESENNSLNLYSLLSSTSDTTLQKMKSNLVHQWSKSENSWSFCWNRSAGPIFKRYLNNQK